MKRYLLFAGEAYYPNGGIEDFIGAFDTVQEAEVEAQFRYPSNLYYTAGRPKYDWWQVVDREDMQMFSGGTNQ